ncbi:MAG: nucleoside hydrolase [Pseudomonadales bacterium]
MRQRHRLLIDCDPGHDDALALLLASRVAEVVGITTVSGNAPLEAVTANALALAELAGLDTPVHAGAARPLAGEPLHAPKVHGASGLDGTHLPPPRRSIASDDAAGYLVEATRRFDDCWIVAIGPLTNLAEALRRDPTLAGRVAGISIMGGSTGGGNATAAAEFNILADPESADVVFRSGARLVMCGLNLTHQLRSSDVLLERLRGRATPRSRFGADVIAFLHQRMATLIGERSAALHDPCAVLAVTHPELIDRRPRSVRVELDGRWTRGMTVVDERPGQGREPGNVDVAYRIDPAAAMNLVEEALT